MIMGINEIRVSHTSINDFNNCAKLYYFKNIYRNPKTGNRVQIVNPYLSLGSAVHDTIDEVINYSPFKRSKISLIKEYNKIWKNYCNKKGGFHSKKQENDFKKRGAIMIKKFEKSTILKSKSMKKDEKLPTMTLTKKSKLMGSFDWVEILKNGNLHIIDFKTGKNLEKKDSWQLLIYHLLAEHNYKKKVEKLSYWYLQTENGFISKKIIESNDFLTKLKLKASEIEETINNNNFNCSNKYKKCYWCQNYDLIISGKAEEVGFDPKMKKDLYYINNQENLLEKIKEKEILNKNEKEILIMRMSGKSVQEVEKLTKLSKKKISTISFEIKKKIKENLTKKELICFVDHLEKGGEKFIM